MPDNKTIAVDRDLLLAVKKELEDITANMKDLWSSSDASTSLKVLKVCAGTEKFDPGETLALEVQANAKNLDKSLSDFEKILQTLSTGIKYYLQDVQNTESSNTVTAEDLLKYVGSTDTGTKTS